MVTIRAVRLVPVAIPLVRPLRTASAVVRARRGVIVVVDAGGLQGLGEALPHPAAPESAVGDTERALADAAGWLRGASLEHLDALLARAGGLPPAAAASVDLLLHDLAARARGVPVSAMLGGARRTPVPASALLDGDTLEVLGAAARAAVAAGFRVAKVKVEPTTPVETMVRALRAAAPGLRLRLDANGCWTAAEALAACGTLDPAAVEWVEQPLAAAPAEPRLAELAAVRRRLPVPLALDESVTSAVSVGAIAAAGAADVIVLKLAQVGGLGAALAAARAARNAGLGVTVTTSIDTGIATAAALHLASVLDGGLACGVATSGLLAGDVVREGMPPRPRMAPPPGPGLGVTLDPAALARFRVPEAA